jgi:hypothetical protein
MGLFRPSDSQMGQRKPERSVSRAVTSASEGAPERFVQISFIA